MEVTLGLEFKQAPSHHKTLFDAYVALSYQPADYRSLFDEMLAFEEETGHNQFSIHYFECFYRWVGADENDTRRDLVKDFLQAVSRQIIASNN